MPLSLLAVVVALGCGASSPTSVPSDKEAAPARSEESAAGEAHVHGVVPSASLTHGMHQQLAPNTAGILKQQGAEGVYDVSAPATVLVTTPWGHGSGVLVDPRGWVLTNYHVVAGGETADLGIEVEVTLVELGADGSASPGKRHRAQALKIDTQRDLALLQLLDAPTDLPTAPLAREDPRPGRRVLALGHAGVGFGWAVKHCSINAIGTLESRVAATMHLRDERYTGEERQQIEAAMATAAKRAGRQIQSDCGILPGDSGGPLIDEESHQLVGLNVSITTATEAATSLGSVAFHIHVEELREFLRDVPKSAKPQPLVPDPWEVGGFEAALDDTDGNGEYDTFRLAGPCGPGFSCHAIFVDMQQRSFPRGKPVPPLATIHRDRSFHPDFIVMWRARPPRTVPRGATAMVPVIDTLFYYDGDHDGELEGLLVIDAESSETRAFTSGPGGHRRDAARDGTEISPELFVDPESRTRFASFRATLNTGVSDAGSARRTVAVEQRVSDFTGDGIPETVQAETQVDERTLVDLGQSSLGTLEGEALRKALDAGSIDFGFVAVSGTPVRAWYDTDGDGHLDLQLQASSWEAQFAVAATRHEPDGSATPAPEHVGRRLLRPGLVREPALAERLGQVLSRTAGVGIAALDDGRSSLPEPVPSVAAQVQEVVGSKGGAVAVADFTRVLVLFDLDGDSLRGRDAPPDVAAAVQSGRFDAEFVYVFDGALAWAFYDRTGDGSFDAVYVARGDDPLTAIVRYDVARSGAVTPVTTAAGEKMFRADRFAKAGARRVFTRLSELVVESP